MLGIFFERKNQIIKVTKMDLKEMRNHMKAELLRMQELRKEGNQGRIEFVDFL